MKKHHFELYCKEPEMIENYDLAKADNFKNWVCHHRLELTLDGEFANSHEDLKRMDMYYNRPAFELIFLTKQEHQKIHGNGESDCTKHRRSVANKDRKFPNRIVSDATRKKMSESHKGSKGTNLGRKLSTEWKENIRKAANGRKWSEESKRKLAESRKKMMRVYNEDGTYSMVMRTA